jgi:hypothetical protein
MLNPTALPPGYAYFYGGGMMPGSFQYGTPAIYPVKLLFELILHYIKICHIYVWNLLPHLFNFWLTWSKSLSQHHD